MEELEISCEIDGPASTVEFIQNSIGGLTVTCYELEEMSAVAISRADAAQLRDWLNEFLKEGE